MESRLPLHPLRARRAARDTGASKLSAGERILVWACASQLDEQLAGGADPTRDPRLAQRARQLSTRSVRHGLALDLRRAIAESERPRRFSGPDPAAQANVLADRVRLEQLAHRVDGGTALGVRGLAAVSLLVTGSDSPLWTGRSGQRLDECIDAALLGLGH